MKLLTLANQKVVKGEKLGFFSGILMLAPSTLSGYNVCPNASPGCSKACLNKSGYGRYNNVQLARIRRTEMLYNDRGTFFAWLTDDIKSVIRRAAKRGLKPAIRINGLSDLTWLALKFANMFPDVQFYDYTKNFKVYQKFLRGELPANYHLTFSHSEINEHEVNQALIDGGNVAVVFETLPTQWKGYKVINGDETDIRFLDEKNVIVGLTPKGKLGKADKTGFKVGN